MYYLMNKDTIVASFDKSNNKWELSNQRSMLPVGIFEINNWIEDRKANKHNSHLKRLMKDCGCDTSEGFIRVTHAASINDSFWVKKDTEEIAWDDISFYRNDFNDTISKLAFEGLGLYGVQMSSTVPELTTDGSFRKCWKKENGEIYLYKRGRDGAVKAGLEPYCEALASEIISKADPHSVRYSALKFHGEAATKCKAFTNEDTGFVPLRKLVDHGIDVNGLLAFFENLGCREEFQRMLVLDAITFNADRHLGNIGVLVNNDTQDIITIAPNFDFNMSMLPYVLSEEFDDIGKKLTDYAPKIGEDFTRLGQEMLTSEIRKDLINLQGFRFSFRGNNDFKAWRVEIMEEMVNRQISAILKREVLRTRDVFVPKEPVQERDESAAGEYDNARFLKQADMLKEELQRDNVFSSVMEEIAEDNHVYIIASIQDNGNEGFIDFVVHMDGLEIFCEKNGSEAAINEVSKELENFDEVYGYFCRAVDSLPEIKTS